MASRAPSVAPAPVARPAEPGRTHARVQRASLKVSHPSDSAEREAEATARHVMSMPAPAVSPRARVSLLAARAPAAGTAPKPKADETSPELTADIKSQLGGGRPLPAETRSFLEPRFKANFAGVRIHTDGKAQNLSTRLGARAFTYGRDIFFNAGAFQPDTPEGMELIAHELTHTIQQQEVVQRQVETAEFPTIAQKSGPQVQRGIVSEALDWIADKANYIPGFRLFTIVIGRNPINMSHVERSGANILRALIEFIPGGHLIVEALENHGVIQKGGKFIEDQFAALGDLGAALRDALMEFIDSLGWRDIFHLGSLWDRAKRIFTVPVDKAIAFGKGLVSGIATLVKDAIIKPLGRWAAANIPKWDLLVGVFGKNPISDEGESPASQLIGAFMNLIGQGEIWENIKKGNAVAKAWAWFQKAMKGALSLVTSIPGRVMSTIRSLTIFDIVTLVGAFRKIVGAFASFVGDFIGWAGGTVLSLLEIILSVVAPTVIPYLKKAGGAFSSIIRNPVGFVRTLVRAGVQGFRQFAGNFLTHLKASLIGWLTGAMAGAGIYIPSGFTLIEILKFVLSVMGLTWANIRAKLVAATSETVVKALETGFDIVKTLVTEGPAAAWQKIVETLTNLKQMAIDAVMDFVKSKVVEAAVTKLLSMLNPAGAFIQAIIAIYNTIMFFVERIRTIAQVAASFIDGIAAIAAGNIAPAANRVEQTMAGLLTLVISFLARIAGLGKVSDAVLGLVKKIRDPIDKALDKVVAWIVDTAKKLGKMVVDKISGKPVAETRTPAQKEAAVVAAQKDADELISKSDATAATVTNGLAGIKNRHKLTSIALNHDGDQYYVDVAINPSRKSKKRKFDPMDMVVGDIVIVRHKDIKLKGGEKITWIPGSATAVDKSKLLFNWASANLKTQRTWAGIRFSDQDVKWKKGHTSQVIISDIKLIELNQDEIWTDFNDARAVLNWRHHEFQLNPSGKQWEHIIERFAGGPNSSDNLALTASTVNNKLGKMFGDKYASHEGPPGQPGTNGLPLRHALKSQPVSAQTIWKHFFYGQLKVSLRNANSPRGRWRELA